MGQQQMVWEFSDKMLSQVVGDSEQDIMEKRRLLKRSYIGKELKRVYSPKRNTYVYRIGHTNQIISEKEFATYVNRDLIVPRFKSAPEQFASTTKHVARQLVGAGNTGTLPVVTPDYRTQLSGTRPQPQIQQSGAHFAKQPAPSAQRVPAIAAQQRMQPVPAMASTAAAVAARPSAQQPSHQLGVPEDLFDTDGDTFSAAEDALSQTGMLQAIKDTDFFDNTDAPKFEDFMGESEPTRLEAAKTRLSGFLSRFKR